MVMQWLIQGRGLDPIGLAFTSTEFFDANAQCEEPMKTIKSELKINTESAMRLHIDIPNTVRQVTIVGNIMSVIKQE